MSNRQHIGQTGTRRRDTLTLPKRRHHLLLVLLLMSGLFAGIYYLSNTLGSETDAEARGSVSVSTLPEDQKPTPLDAAELGLPDLLASTVPIGENPTEGLELSGTPSGASGTAPTSVPERPSNPRVIRPAIPIAPPLDPSLTRETPSGIIPSPNGSGLTPLRAYAADRVATNGKQPVAIIIGGLGINPALTSQAIKELPSAVTLSFAAQSENLQDWVNQARAYGHEVLLEVPMQGTGEVENELTLLSTGSPQANVERLHKTLTRAQGYIGLTHYQGENFLRRTDAVSPILMEMRASGLAFVSDGSFETPALTPLTRSLNVPYRSGFGLIDPVPSRKVVTARLSNLADTASDQSGIIGVGFAYPETLETVTEWSATLEGKGLILVPASQMLPS